MKNFVVLMAVSLMVSCVARQGVETENLSREVNPLIGTDFTGNTYPGAQAPHGMVQLSPDNGLPGWDRIAGYFYPDSTIAGFSHTHLSGTGAGDLYDISFMPVVEPLSIAEAPLGLHSKFSHEREEAWAGYYRVHLDDYNIDVELTATPRCGIQRYTYNEKQDGAMVVLNLSKATNWDRTLDWHVEQRDSVTLVGYRFSDGWARLDSLFSYKPAEGEELPIFSTGMIGQYVHGNEPCHHVAYLYNYTGEPQKTQQYVSEIMHGQYSNTPAGLCGNEDCGQMSAWLVWSALGMYPIDPVSLEYELGVPLFEEATVNLPEGKQLLVKATGVSKEHYAVREVKLNGALLSEPRISHEQLMKGGLLEFVME